MTFEDVMKELEGYGDERTKSTLMKHGAMEPFFGVKVQDMKKIVKKVKKDHELSLKLFNSGNTDAMYLAGLIADENRITPEQLDDWADKAYWYYLSEYAVPWVAAETDFGFRKGLEWIESNQERIVCAGWATLSSYAAVNEDSNLDISTYSLLLDRVEKEIHSSQNRVRYVMNGFVIAVGTYITKLNHKSLEVATRIGKVNVEMGGTACKVPLASDYIQKVIVKNYVGKKRKTARC